MLKVLNQNITFRRVTEFVENSVENVNKYRKKDIFVLKSLGYFEF